MCPNPLYSVYVFLSLNLYFGFLVFRVILWFFVNYLDEMPVCCVHLGPALFRAWFGGEPGSVAQVVCSLLWVVVSVLGLSDVVIVSLAFLVWLVVLVVWVAAVLVVWFVFSFPLSLFWGVALVVFFSVVVWVICS